MKDMRVVTIQDISCFGQCALTAALPVISACGIETVVIPTAVLSTHPTGFSGFTCRDLGDDIPAIAAHWKSLGLTFDAVYTGYLGSVKQIKYVKIKKSLTSNLVNDFSFIVKLNFCFMIWHFLLNRLSVL